MFFLTKTPNKHLYWFTRLLRMKILGLIPARIGSKGLPQKNIKNLLGKPLITYSIDAAKKSKKIDRVIVSTDNLSISKISIKHGAETPFLRPKSISKDDTPIGKVISHSLNFLKKQNYVPDVIVIVQPTSPLRTSNLIDKGVNKLLNCKADSVISVSKIKQHPFGSFSIHQKYLKFFKPNSENFFQRQKYPSLYFPTGALYVFWNKTFKTYKSIYGKKILPLITPQEEAIDIDTTFDFFVCEMILKNWKLYNRKH